MRERGGRTLPQVFAAEKAAIATIGQRIARGTVVHADESPAWNPLHARYSMRRINHQHGYSIGGACTNAAESYFSRLCRAELGHHHHIAGPYLLRYAQEAAWREDLRRVSNGEQADGVVELAMGCPPSVDFCGYWQRAQSLWFAGIMGLGAPLGALLGSFTADRFGLVLVLAALGLSEAVLGFLHTLVDNGIELIAAGFALTLCAYGIVAVGSRCISRSCSRPGCGCAARRSSSASAA